HLASVGGSSKPLTRKELLTLIRRYGITAASEEVVFQENEAVEAAERIGYPVAMKLASEKIAHKTDVGGVRLWIASRQQAVQAFNHLIKVAEKLGVKEDGVVVQETVQGLELIIGSKFDGVFGPIVTVGIGGVLTEVIRDFTVFVSPVEEDEAEMMLNSLRFSKLLEGFRGLPPVDREILRKTIVNFSKILSENPSISQLEINPLTVNGEKALAVDVRGWTSLHEST
ncbi:MAG: acetate--CoA ligase family protein, partial [Nitrososphaerales archaeon]